MIDRTNNTLIGVLKRGLAREEEKIERAQAEIIKLKMELLELGVELPLQESEPNRRGQARFSRAGKEAMSSEKPIVGAGESSPAPDGSRSVCTAGSPMPKNAPGRWQHPDAKSDPRNDPYYDHYDCPHCGLHFAVEVAE